MAMAEQFLRLIDASLAHRLFREAVRPAPVGDEIVPLEAALFRVLAEDVFSPADVPGFDRSNVDGFALCAADTFGADEAHPRRLALEPGEVRPGAAPPGEVAPGAAMRIATGAMLPRGADAVLMAEHAEAGAGEILVHRALAPGANVSFAGSDLARGESVLGRGTRLSARETGTLAAAGIAAVRVFRRPRVAVFSTGDEIVPPGAPIRPGLVFDANLALVRDALREIGCAPIDLGVVPDEPARIRAALERAIEADAVVFSGGTSKGEGDLSAAAIREVATIVCHGVAVKPGKPLILAVAERRGATGAARVPIACLPGFPASAIFTFHEFVVPILLAMAGAPREVPGVLAARVPVRIAADRGRTEFVLVSLVGGPAGPAAYPIAKGSGAVTSFARADGFLVLGREREFVEPGEECEVRLLGREVRPADFVAIGSHCLGLDLLLSMVREEGFSTKSIAVGSQGGLIAAGRGECDLAGIHLCDEKGIYNAPFLKPGMRLLPGYGRMQGIVFRGEAPPLDLFAARMVNRNRGSGTRVLVDEILRGARPPGYHFEVKSHNAVAAAVAQGRADWGVAIAPVAAAYGLGFRPLREERFDFAVPEARWERPAVAAFRRILASDEARRRLRESGFSA
jgi:putative molybdopterin biosynthesis protein